MNKFYKNILNTMIILVVIITSLSSCKNNSKNNESGITQTEVSLIETNNIINSNKSDGIEKITGNDSIQYTWFLEPCIEADDIIVMDLDKDLYANYAIINKGHKYGIISKEGKMVTDFVYDYYYGCSISNGMYSMKESTKRDDNFIYKDGEIVLSDLGHGHDGSPYFIFYKDRDRNQVYYTETYGSGCQFEIGKMELQNIKGDCYPLQEICNISVEQEYDYGVLYKWDRTGKWGLVSDNGDIIEECIYDKGGFSNNLVMMKKDGKWGYFNRRGERIIDNIALDTYKDDNNSDITNLEDKQSNGYFPFRDVDGIIAVNTYNDGGIFFNLSGTQLTEKWEFEEVRPAIDGYAWVKKDKKWGVIKIKID